MRKIQFTVLAAGAALLILAGCGNGDGAVTASQAPHAPESAEAFLKWSMDRYKELPTLHAKSQLKMTYDGQPQGAPQDREIFYEKPNKFKLQTRTSDGMTMTAVSDGSKLVEYTNAGQATSAPAPDSIATAKSMVVSHPMFCGSLLHQFFGGSDNYGSLVNAEKGKVTFGNEEKAGGGEPARVVKFYGQQQYGHVEALIGKNTGHVFRIKYDSEPMVQSMTTGEMAKKLREAAKAQIAQMKPGPDRDRVVKMLADLDKPHSFLSEETFAAFEGGAKVAAANFDTKLPEGVVARPSASEQDKPPVPLGKPAPDFEVAGVDGKPVKLSSMRGHVVLIDFWATWCGPCREGLPETNRLAKAGGATGLQVMGISDEDPGTITGFLKENKYTFPAYVDANGKAAALYGVSGIPTTVVIDAEGNLSSYLVGLRDPSEIHAALQKAGIKISG